MVKRGMVILMMMTAITNDICLVPAAVKNINTLLFIDSMNSHNNAMVLLVVLYVGGAIIKLA